MSAREGRAGRGGQWDGVSASVFSLRISLKIAVKSSCDCIDFDTRVEAESLHRNSEENI